MDDELELQLSDRLRTLIASDPDVIAIENVALPLRELTPSGVAGSDGVVLALDNIGGDARMATTGEIPNAGKDAHSFYLVLSVSINIPERSGGDPEAVRAIVKRKVMNTCGVLRKVLRRFSSDQRRLSDPLEWTPLWHKIELAQPGWDYPEAEGQYRQGRIYLRVYTQQRRI